MRTVVMRGQPNGHTVAFRAKHLATSEAVFGYLEGWISSRTPNSAREEKPGQLILTSQRVCLYRKGLLGDHLREIDLSQITSVEEIEQSAFRHLRVRSSSDELIFRTAEAKDIWELVLDRLEKVRADPSWEPPQPVPASTLDQPPSPFLPATRFAAPGRTPLAMMIDRLARQYELDELFISPADQSAIGLNFRERKLLMIANSRELPFRFDQIVSVEATADDVTLSQTNRGSQLMGAAIGGALLGGTGILLGGLTGSSRSAQRVRRMALKLTIDDTTSPSHTICFFATRDKKGLPASNPAVSAAGAALERIHAQIVLAMRQAQAAETSQAPASLGEVEKLWELKERGALTGAEFDEQKRRLLGSSKPPSGTSAVSPGTFALRVLDWGHDQVRTIATMREMEPSLGLIAAMKMYGSPSQCLARDLPLAEAARIKARLFATGVIAEMKEEVGTEP